MTAQHQLLLNDLVADVQARIEEGPIVDGTPVPLSYRQAVRWMSHRNYLRSARYRDQRFRADVGGLDEDVHEFAESFMRMMGRLGIPVHVETGYVSRGTQARLYVLGRSPHMRSPHSSRRTVSLVHSVRGRDLPDVCWQVFEHVGREVAGRVNRKAQWGGSTAPWLWTLDVV